MPATPALGPALRRLHQPAGPTGAARRAGRGSTGSAGCPGGCARRTRELALLGRTPEQYALSLLLSALVGLATPTLLGVALLSLLGARLPFVVPVLGSLGLALLRRSAGAPRRA